MKVWTVEFKGARAKRWTVMSIHLFLFEAKESLKITRENMPGHSVRIATYQLKYLGII